MTASSQSTYLLFPKLVETNGAVFFLLLFGQLTNFKLVDLIERQTTIALSAVDNSFHFVKITLIQFLSKKPQNFLDLVAVNSLAFVAEELVV